MPEKELILNIPVTSDTKERIIKIIKEVIQNKSPQITIFCANPHSLVIAKYNGKFRSALKSADILLPDGAGIVIASKFLGGSIKEKIPGPDLFLELTRQLNNPEYNYFFLGSVPKTLKRIKQRLIEEFPLINCVGSYSPPFTPITEEENRKLIQLINKSKPDVLWVGMTAPKQEKWIWQNRSKLKVPVVAAIGAAFDFFAGTKRRAPEWLRKNNLEWLYRFIHEPARLWKRYLISTPLFLTLALFGKMLYWSNNKKNLRERNQCFRKFLVLFL